MNILEIMAKAMWQDIPSIKWEELKASGLHSSSLDEIKAALKAAEKAGWVMVPGEPTHEMLVASRKALDIALQSGEITEDELSLGNKVLNKKQHYVKAKVRYKAMIAARPRIDGGGDEQS